MKNHIKCFLATRRPSVLEATVLRQLQGCCCSQYQPELRFPFHPCCLTFLWSALRIAQLQSLQLYLTEPLFPLWASALTKYVTAVSLIGHSKCFIYSLHAMLQNWFWHMSMLTRPYLTAHIVYLPFNLKALLREEEAANERHEYSGRYADTSMPQLI